MKKLSLLAISLLTATSFAAELVSIPVTEVFVPNGFDDNDTSLVVIDGYLPDPCHQLDNTDVIYNESTHTFELDQKARRVGGFCPDVIVPFTTEVDLGVLARGNYKVKLAHQEKLKALEVAEAQSKTLPDDHLYAPVDQARIQVEGKDRVYAVIKGRYTSSCLGLANVEVIKTGETIQVLPIMKLTEEDPHGLPCTSDIREFEVATELPKLENQNYLLHVRSLNGKSRNVVFNPFVNK